MQASSVPAAVAIGSNVGDRAVLIRESLRLLGALPTTTILRTSRLIQTAPVAVHPGPGDLGGPYLNAAAMLETRLDPRELLDELLSVERRLGRVRDAGNRSAPRTIDLDLILYADRVLDEPGLTIPHPRMHLRRFVLEPLSEIAPDWVVPTLNRTVGQLLDGLPADPSSDGANNQA